VTLKVGTQTFTQSAEIRKSPRSSATPEDLQSQFDLLINVRDRLSEAHDAINRIRALQKDIGDSNVRAKAVAQGAPLVAAGEKLSAALQSVVTELYEPRYTGQDDQMLIFPLKLNNRLVGLQGYVAGADTAPTAQAFSVYRELSTDLDQLLARLRTVLDTDLPAYNQLLQSRGLPTVRR